MDAMTDVLMGGGDLGARMRAVDWSQTALGPVEHWPQPLRTAVRILLTSRQPMFVWWGPELVNLYNDAYCSILGGKHPAALGQPASVVWREIWNDVGPRAAHAMQRNEGTYDEALLLIMERNGYPEETYYTFSYSPIPDESGGPGGILCANTDDTERIVGTRQLGLLRDIAARTMDVRTVEEAARRAALAFGVESRDLPFALIYLADEDGCTFRLIAASEGARGTSVAVEHIDDDAERSLAAVLETGESRWREVGNRYADAPRGGWDVAPTALVEIPLVPPGQNTLRAVLVLGLNPYRLYDERYRGFVELVAGQVGASLASAAADEEEQRRADALAALDRAKTTFFSNVSHEFRTPLTLMLGPLAEVLQSAVLPTPERDALETVQRNSLRLLKLVNALLDFSRIEAGRAQASYVPTDLATYTAGIASNFAAAMARAGLRYEIDCAPLPELAWVDRDLWEKVVLNLVSNAFKFTLEGGVRVSLRAEGSTHAVLEIADTGTGIPAHELPKLFDRFHRVEGSRGRTYEGSGIGLALVHELVALHGGSVGVTSEWDVGTTFTVRVPLGHAHLDGERLRTEATLADGIETPAAQAYVGEALRWLPAANDRESVDAALSAASESGRPCIVLADDNADMRDYVRRLLEPHYGVVAVADGEAALRAVHAHAPALVLSDVMMPKLDGFGLLRALRAEARTRDLPIVLLSARAGEAARVEGLAAGADDYLVKPFSSRELLGTVAAKLELARLRNETARALGESEERFRNMADHAPMMVWVTESDGRCTYLSKSWFAYTGQDADDALGFGWLEAVHADDRVHAAEVFERATATQDSFRIEYRLRRHDGRYGWALDAASPRFDDAGNFRGYIGSVIDITDRRRAEDALRDADRRKDEFIATLAHELRNPLAPIRTGVAILGHPRADANAAAQALTVMDRQLNHMVRLIDELLDVSRISLGKVELKRSVTDVADVLAAAVETARPLIDLGGHHLTVSLPPERLSIDGDAMRLAQVFANLLNNAAKYTDAGGQLALTAARDGREVVITMRDDGIGIAPDQLDHVFELFAQVRRTQSRAQGGLGIGLALAKRLVELHGGTIAAASDGPGRGSVFTVRLPIAAGAAESQPEPAAPATPARRRVLVVDDNIDAADSLAALLGMLGHDAVTANDGVAALAVASTFDPDLILLDLGMPRLDGFDTCRALRARESGRRARIVALTGWGQQEDRRRSQEAGFDDHLVKPVDLDALRQVAGL